MDTFRALVVDKHGDQLMADILEIESVHLPEGDVTVDVAYSSLNYKDGLVLNGLGGLVKTYPHVPGIDYAGTVSYSDHPDFTRGDRVIGTGFRVGEVRWGGYAQRVSVSGDWLVSLPQSLSLYRAMCLGSAGLTAAISLRTLEEHGLHPNQGEVLIT
ncbi:MAG: oxidoreductase, partial [Candidatus Latescibacterota bacterium]|nr:oxidoreductase [Candidatus Latescibacterota bacterium]